MKKEMTRKTNMLCDEDDASLYEFVPMLARPMYERSDMDIPLRRKKRKLRKVIR
jgi:hypothetical protein